MSLPLTRETLAAAYEYLRSTPPFERWNLPEPEDVAFKVSRSARQFGWYQWDGNRHTITASERSIAHTATLIQLMAHEMVHLYLEHNGWESKSGDTSVHNAAYRKLAARVCKVHGFDPKAFF